MSYDSHVIVTSKSSTKVEVAHSAVLSEYVNKYLPIAFKFLDYGSNYPYIFRQKNCHMKMELDSILNTLEILGNHGYIVSTEESLVLYNSLLLLQNENHFRKVFFWGRIYGSEKDYYIAFGYNNDVISGKTYYYSMNCLDWGLLPHPTDKGKLLTPLCTTRFQGDPALVIDVLLEKYETALGKPLQAPKVMKLKEEDRLATVVYMVNEETLMAPRGALFKRPDGVVVENLCFEGLTDLEAMEVTSYLHTRVPHQKWNTNLLMKQDYNYAMDFLDPLDVDVPEGCWVSQICSGGQLSLITSLYWPGMTLYHYIHSPKYGFVYFGNGKKILDVPFLLPSL